jgi:hypothetical protein
MCACVYEGVSECVCVCVCVCACACVRESLCVCPCVLSVCAHVHMYADEPVPVNSPIHRSVVVKIRAGSQHENILSEKSGNWSVGK